MNRVYVCVLICVSFFHHTSAINYECSICPVGKYKSLTSNNDCVDCPANTYQDVLGATSSAHCKPCPPNAFAPAGSGSSTSCQCGAGYAGDVARYSTGPRNVNLQRSCGPLLTDACETLQNKDNLPSSRAVDLNMETQSMSIPSVSGDANFFVGMTTYWRVRFERQAIVQNLEIYNTDHVNRMTTFSVRVGNVADPAQMTQNTLCASNVVWPTGVALVQVSCTQAVQGQYLYIINGASTNLVLNNVQVIGFLLPEAADICVACSAGTYKTSIGTANCTQCASGTASAAVAATAASVCVRCLANSYAGPGAAVCAQCPEFSKSEAGSFSPEYCLCNAGYTSAPSTLSCNPFQTLYQSKRPWAHYSGTGWNAQTKVLADASGNGRHTVNTGQQGGIQGLSMREAGATNAIPFIRGSTLDRLDFPDGSIPQSFTICSLTKYAGSSQAEQGRILTSLNTEWWHGHHGTQRGVARYASQTIMSSDGLTKLADPVWNTQQTGVSPNTDWLVMCSKNGGVTPWNVLANGQAVGTSTRSDGNVSEWPGQTVADQTQNMNAGRSKRMCINCYIQKSSWDLAQLLIWDSHLNDNEMQTVTTELQRYATMNTQCSVIPGDGCVACAAGKYKPSDGGAPCIDCVAGKYRAFEAATAENMCIPCPANTFSLSASTQHTNCSCNAGYSGATNGVPCDACAAGKYKTAVGIGTCTDCAANEFSTVVAQVTSTCSSCPSFAQAPAGSDEAVDCKCNAGYTGADGQTCLACVEGTFKPLVGASTCTLCGNNTYSSVVAATSSSVCLACQSNSTSLMGSTRQSDCHCLRGFLTNNLGAANATCEICSAGSYNSQLGATTCSKCGAGFKSSTPGAVSIETCTECGVNTYSAAGAAQCEICPINTFAPARSDVLGDCKCLAGFYSQVTGQDGLPCSACEAGKHKAQTGAVPCTDCPANRFSTATAATSNATCLSCTANAVAPIGSGSPTMCLCNLGYFNEPKYYANLARSCGVSENQACPVTSSEVHPNSPPAHAWKINDGDLDFWHSSSLLKPGRPAWFRIDFGVPRTVTAVDFWLGTCEYNAGWTEKRCHQTNNWLVAVSNVASLSLLANVVGNYDDDLNVCKSRISNTLVEPERPPKKVSITCDNIYTGQYMYIYSYEPIDNYLTFAEIIPSGSGGYSETCAACSAGKFKSTLGSAACTNCPADTYSGLTARTSNSTCTPCYEFSVSPPGSDNIDDCSCSAGFQFS